MKKIKALIKSIIALTMVFMITTQPVYAQFSGWHADVVYPRVITPPSHSTTPRVKRPYVEPPKVNKNKVGWRLYLVETDDISGSNPRIMEGTDTIDVIFSTKYLDELDAAALWTRVGGGEASRFEEYLTIDGSPMPKPTAAGPQTWWKTEGSGGSPNALKVIREYWGDAIAEKFKDTTHYNFIVMEPIAWGTLLKSTGGVDAQYVPTLADNSRQMFYGTVYQWLMYAQLVGIDSNSWGNKELLARQMPLKVMLEDNWLELRDTHAVYEPYTNPSNPALRFTDIGDYGFAIQAFRNDQLCAQSTWDDVSATPSRAPKESEGTWYIHKTYRTKHVTDTGIDYTGDGQFTLPSVTNTISVEAEPPTGYTVVGWRTSTSDPINPDYSNWEGTIPGVVQANGASNKN